METTILNIKKNKKIINEINNCNIMKNSNLIFNKFCSSSIYSKDDLEIYSSSPNLSNEQFWPPPSNNNNKNKKKLIKYLMFKL